MHSHQVGRARPPCRPPLELPEDPSVEELPDPLRRAIGRHWLERSAAERGVAIAFRNLLPRLRDVGAAEVVLALAAKAIDDEERHADLCVQLAARYFGAEVDAPAPRDGTLPVFGTGDEPTEVALLALGMCCINESIASEWIRSCWAVASAPLAIAANRHHLRDEIDHARLGWAHLGSDAVSAPLRRRLRPWAPKLVAVNVAEWKKPDRHLPPEGVPAHGHLSAAEQDEVIDAAVRDLVVPGLARIGLA